MDYAVVYVPRVFDWGTCPSLVSLAGFIGVRHPPCLTIAHVACGFFEALTSRKCGLRSRPVSNRLPVSPEGLIYVCTCPRLLIISVGSVAMPVYSLRPLGRIGRTGIIGVLVELAWICLPVDPVQLLARLDISL